MYDPKFKQLNLMVDNVLLPNEASTLFRTSWKDTNFSIWIKEIFLERFTKEVPPRYLKFWHITDDIVMCVIGNLLEVSGLESMDDRRVLSMRTEPGKYESTWAIPDKLTNYNNTNKNAKIIVEGQHLNKDRMKCSASLIIDGTRYKITTIIISTLNYLPAFKKDTVLSNKETKGFYLTLLSQNLKTELVEKIIDTICELNDHYNELSVYKKSIKELEKFKNDKELIKIDHNLDYNDKDINENDINDDETIKFTYEKKDSESKASKIWQDMISMKNSLNCANCFDVKKHLSEEKFDK